VGAVVGRRWRGRITSSMLEIQRRRALYVWRVRLTALGAIATGHHYTDDHKHATHQPELNQLRLELSSE